MTTLCHCGKPAEREQQPDPWEGRLDGYCDLCALVRCDAFPGACRKGFEEARARIGKTR